MGSFWVFYFYAFFFFFLTESKTRLVETGNDVSLGVLFFLQKIKSVWGNVSLSFSLQIGFQLKAMFSINKGKILPQLNWGHPTLSQPKDARCAE